MADESFTQGVHNWRNSPDPFGRKVRKAFRNNMKKVATLKPCCGHHGEPGC